MLLKIKAYKQNLKNPFSSLYETKSPSEMLKNVTEKNLLTYVRKMQSKLRNGEIDSDVINQKICSKRLAQNIISIREKFSLGDALEAPTRKIISVDENMKFTFKRRSVDVVSIKELKKKAIEGRLVKVLGDGIFEVGHQDFQV